jgi:multiple sugar transport system permease protein
MIMKRITPAILYTILGAAAIVMLFPFVWMVLTSFKSLAEINLMPPTVLPHRWDWANYIHAWFKPESTFGRYMWNSFVLAVGGTGLQLLLVIPAAYVFARFDFPGKALLFWVVLATMMIPGEVTLIPNFITVRHFPFFGGNNWMGVGGKGLYDSHLGMILPGAVGAFSVFMLRQAFMNVPKEYWEASQLDGCSRRAYLLRILLPLSAPAVITVALFGLLGRWNALIWPLIITSSEAMRPIQVGMLLFAGEEGPNYHYLLAAATFSMLPGILLYLIAQRWFEEGFAASGIKG